MLLFDFSVLTEFKKMFSNKYLLIRQLKQENYILQVVFVGDV